MSYENKFVDRTLSEEGEDRVAFRLKQAEYSGQQGDVLFLSAHYPSAVLEGKKLSATKEKEPDTSYNSYYFGEHAKKQYKKTRDFAQNAGLRFCYFYYCTFGRGHAAEFHVIPADYFEDKIDDGAVSISLRRLRWNSIEEPWFKNLND